MQNVVSHEDSLSSGVLLRLASPWILIFCEPHRITSGWGKTDWNIIMSIMLNIPSFAVREVLSLHARKASLWGGLCINSTPLSLRHQLWEQRQWPHTCNQPERSSYHCQTTYLEACSLMNRNKNGNCTEGKAGKLTESGSNVWTFLV